MGNFSKTLVLGVPASGKSTLAKKLSVLTDASHIEVDQLVAQSPENFRELVRNAISREEKWLIEGHFKAIGTIICPLVDSVIWLDPPMPQILIRWLKRALLRKSFRDGRWAVLKSQKLRQIQCKAIADFKKRGIPVFEARSSKEVRSIVESWRARSNEHD